MIKKRNKEKYCKKCGCTDSQACAGGCYWVEDNLCSSCIEIKKTKKYFRINQNGKIQYSDKYDKERGFILETNNFNN